MGNKQNRDSHRIERQIMIHFVRGGRRGAILRIGTGVRQVDAAGYCRAEVRRVMGLFREKKKRKLIDSYHFYLFD